MNRFEEKKYSPLHTTQMTWKRTEILVLWLSNIQHKNILRNLHGAKRIETSYQYERDAHQNHILK